MAHRGVWSGVVFNGVLSRYNHDTLVDRRTLYVKHTDSAIISR